MAAGGAVCRYAADSSNERNEEAPCSEGGALHERLVAYVHSLAHGSRRGVWGEHSYARARGAAPRAARVRALLAPRPPSPPPALVDVLRAPSPPPALAARPPSPRSPSPPAPAAPAADDEWEARAAALAPSAAHARLAHAAAGALRALRLERCAAGGRRGQARAAARRLRRALAPHWAGGAPAWLHATLLQLLPPAARALYREAAAELARAVPRLAARLAPGARPPPGPARAPAGRAVGPGAGPWLVWVSSGCAALDARWEPRLAALVHTRVLRGAAGAPAAAAPEAWCAAAAGAARAALTDALAEAGSRAVVLGGAGAGAAVALVLARGAGGAGGAAGGVRGAVLVAPPLLTAEGARDARDDALAACRLPLLLVVPTAAPDVTRAIANNVAEGGAARRLLEVRGADGQLRLPRRLRARHRLPGHALDAALAEECVRWALETAEQEEPPPAAPTDRRRAHLPPVVREIGNYIPIGGGGVLAPPSRDGPRDPRHPVASQETCAGHGRRPHGVPRPGRHAARAAAPAARPRAPRAPRRGPRGAPGGPARRGRHHAAAHRVRGRRAHPAPRPARRVESRWQPGDRHQREVEARRGRRGQRGLRQVHARHPRQAGGDRAGPRGGGRGPAGPRGGGRGPPAPPAAAPRRAGAPPAGRARRPLTADTTQRTFPLLSRFKGNVLVPLSNRPPPPSPAPPLS